MQNNCNFIVIIIFVCNFLCWFLCALLLTIVKYQGFTVLVVVHKFFIKIYFYFTSNVWYIYILLCVDLNNFFRFFFWIFFSYGEKVFLSLSSFGWLWMDRSGFEHAFGGVLEKVLTENCFKIEEKSSSSAKTRKSNKLIDFMLIKMQNLSKNLQILMKTALEVV